MRTLVLGDPHGGRKSMLQCFERASFDYEKDQLICLGDTADGWPDARQCFDELLKVKNLIYIIGNHDAWFLDWALQGVRPEIWFTQGGKATIKSYGFDHTNVPKSHVALLKDAPYFYVDGENRCFVHGGFNPHVPLRGQDRFEMMWDRGLIKSAKTKQLMAQARKSQPGKLTDFKEVFVGHTTTYYFDSDKPVHYCEVWDLDTGGGYEGYLTIMDVDTHQFWQSDKLNTLYPGHEHR